MEKIFLIICVSSIFIRCTSRPDPIANCSNFSINVRFVNSSNNDITGDSVNLPTIKYDKDSIRYTIQSISDTTSLLTPTITKNGNINEYELKYNTLKSTGKYYIIYNLNINDRDTIIIDVNGLNQDKIKLYNNNTYLGILNDECQFTTTIIK